MMGRWGLEGMRSFEQASVAKKEGRNLEVSDCAHPEQVQATAHGSF